MNQIKNHKENKKRYEPGRINEILNAREDLVFIENYNKLNKEKLQQICIGLFPIHSKISGSVYLVNIGQNKDNFRLYHIIKIIPV